MNNKDKRKRFDEIITKYENKWDDARRELTTVLQEGVDNHDIYLVAAANYWLGVVSYRDGKSGEVLSYALKASSFFLDSDDYEMSARSYNLLAVVYTVSKEYLLANDAYQKAYDILVEHPCDGFKLIYIINNFSANYYKMGDLEKAIEYAEKCIPEFDKEDPNYFRQLFTICSNLASYYREYGNLEKAFYYVGQMEYAMENGRNYEEAENCYYTILSILNFAAGDKEKGLYYVDRILSLGDIDLGEHDVQEDYERIIPVLLEMSEYDKAKQFIQMLEKQAGRSKATVDKLYFYRSRIAYDEAVGDTKDALLYYKLLRECYEEENKESLATERMIQHQMDLAMDEIKTLWKRLRHSEKRALTDRLTGLYNKFGVEKYVVPLCRSEKGALLLVDLDNFKPINDVYGHQAGDDVLKGFAGILEERCGHEDILCRIGGDEFLVYIQDSLDEDTASSFTKYLNSQITNQCKALFGDDFHISLGASVGAINAVEADDYETLFMLADKMLYNVKRNGKHGCALYKKGRETDEELTAEQELSRMISVLSERGTPHEAMVAGQDVFTWVYRYMARFSIRHKTNTSICALLLSREDSIQAEDFEKDVDRFVVYLQKTLRRNDVLFKASKNTIFLMLPGLPRENADIFMKRIKNGWDSSANNRKSFYVSHSFRYEDEMSKDLEQNLRERV